MLQGYRETGHDPTGTFDRFFRELPPDRGYVVAAGLEQLTFGDAGFEYDVLGLRDEDLPDDVDPEGAPATTKHGVLTVTIPRTPTESESHTIEIESE